MDSPYFLLRALPDDVELTVPGQPLRILSMRPALARQLARNLELYAEKAEILQARGESADVGPREGAIGPEDA